MLSRAIERQKAVAASPPPTGRSRDKARESQRESDLRTSPRRLRPAPPGPPPPRSPPSYHRQRHRQNPAPPHEAAQHRHTAVTEAVQRRCRRVPKTRVQRKDISEHEREQTRKSAERAIQLDSFVCAAAIAARQAERGGSDGVQQARRRDRKAYLLSSPERGLPSGRRRSPGASTQPAEHRRSLCLSSTCCF